MLTFSGAVSIDTAMATSFQQAIALVVFSVVGSLSIGIPVIAYFASSKRVETVLADWKNWLMQNNSGVVIALSIILGALIISNGMKILST